MVNYIDHSSNFWELYKDYRFVSPFKQLYDNDITKNKKYSSQVMWFISFCYSKVSKYKNMSEVSDQYNKFQVVSEIVFNNPTKYESIENLQELKESFLKLNLSAVERNLLMWDQLLDNRTRFLQTQDYNLQNFDELDKMAANTSKVVDAIKKLKDELSKEEGAGLGKGGAEISLNE